MLRSALIEMPRLRTVVVRMMESVPILTADGCRTGRACVDTCLHYRTGTKGAKGGGPYEDICTQFRTKMQHGADYVHYCNFAFSLQYVVESAATTTTSSPTDYVAAKCTSTTSYRFVVLAEVANKLREVGDIALP